MIVFGVVAVVIVVAVIAERPGTVEALGARSLMFLERLSLRFVLATKREHLPRPRADHRWGQGAL
jgi:hypothetical protein